MRVSATVRLRPTRIGFLVEPTDLESLRRIFQVCTCLWGGAFNPIIPVCDELPEAWRSQPAIDPTPTRLTAGYIHFFEPDVFVESKPGLAEKAGISRVQLNFAQSSVATLDEYFAAPQLPFGLDCRGAYRAIWAREFKFLPSREPRVAEFGQADRDAAWIEMAFGGFPASGELAPLARAYRDAFKPAEFTPTQDSWAKMAAGGYRSPIDFNNYTLDETRFQNSTAKVTLFVADPTSSLDLIDCWNLRQVRRNTLPVNLNWIGAAPAVVSALLGPLTIASSPADPPEIEVQLGRSVLGPHWRADYDRAQETLRAAGFDLPHVIGPYRDLWAVPRDPWAAGAPPAPQRATVFAGSTLADLELSENLMCQLPALAPEFVKHDSGRAHAARWANVLTFGRPWGDAERLALAIPRSFDLAKHRGFGYTGNLMLASREGLVLPQNYKDERAFIRLMTGPEAFVAWLEDRRIEVARSDAGRAADQVIERLGGLTSTHILHDRKTIELLDKAAKKRRKSLRWEEWGSLLSERAQRAKGPFRPGLDNLVDSRIVRLGLEIECPKCSEANWYALADLKEELACEGCLAKFRLPEGTLDLKHSPWHYRVIGPFSKPNYADGAYAVVLALSLFAWRLATFDSRVSYATGLKMTAQDTACAPTEIECDFALWYLPHQAWFGPDPDPALIFGEAKSFGRDTFKQEDVARMARLRERFPEAFVVFATLRDGLEEGEKELISRLASGWAGDKSRAEAAPIIVLTTTELFCPFDVMAAWSKKGYPIQPSLDPANPWDLAKATQQIYLESPRGAAPPATAPPATQTAPGAPDNGQAL